MGTIPIHTWSSRCGSLDRPDWVVLDLDPKGAPFAHVVEVALDLHSLLADLEIPHHVKTSGASGLHILMPLGRRYGHEEARTFARVLAMLEVERKPRISTVTRQINAREGKVYVDWGQNGYGITIAGPYSLRPVPGASASCPLEWDEVNGKLDPSKFNLRTLPKRFEKMKDPLLPVLGPGLDIAATIARIEKRVHEIAEPAPQKTRRKR
jgi:bifunctional non-homologous end joining protein LigD